MVIVISAGHMVKGIAKFVSWVGFLPYAIRDPFGFKTVHQFTSGMLQIPVPLINKFVVSIIGIVIILISAYFAIRAYSTKDLSPSRKEEKTLIAYFDPDVIKQLKLIGMENEMTIQSMMQEAINDFFAKHGKAQIT